MDKTLFTSLAVFAIVSSATPGPNNLLLVTSAALFGWRQTIPLLSGILVGFAIVMSTAVFGLGRIVENQPWLLTIVRIAGAAWLVAMSLQFLAIARRLKESTNDDVPAPLNKPLRFYQGVLFQWINPKALVLAFSSAGAYIAIADLVVQRVLIIVGVFFLTGLLSCSAWMIAGHALNRYMSTGKPAKYINFFMGILLLATALYILLG